jgi:hypothetical protein
MAPLSLIFLSVPVSSAASAGPPASVAAAIAGMIHLQRIVLLPC